MKISGTAAAPRKATERVVSALNRYPLKSLLLGSVALVVLFCLLVVVYSAREPGGRLPMVDSLITVDNVISDLCLKSTAAMVDARRLEKDFLLNYQEFGFEESRSRYITRLLTAVVGIRENWTGFAVSRAIARLRDLTREIETALDRYGRASRLWPTSSESAAITTPAPTRRWRPRCGKRSGWSKDWGATASARSC